MDTPPKIATVGESVAINLPKETLARYLQRMQAVIAR